MISTENNLEALAKLRAELLPVLTAEHLTILDEIAEALQKESEALTMKDIKESAQAGTALVKLAEFLVEFFTNNPP
jgi:hypothetical protein